MASRTSYCPNCGSPQQQGAGSCCNCGQKITTQAQPAPETSSIYYPPPPAQQPPVSTGPYKVIIAVLLIIILFLGIGYLVGSAHLPFSPGYRYQLANPPNVQSTLPKPTFTSQLPQYPIWNSCGVTQCTMTSNGWREGSVPDTFDYYVSFTSTVNVTVYFFTMGQFVQFSVCNGDVNCVSGDYDSIPATTNLPRYTLFALGEGCADYLAIYVASGTGTMTPQVGVTRSPSPPQIGPTGYCAQAGA